jgi:hypothetical protein
VIPVCRLFEQAYLPDAIYLFLPLFLSAAFPALVLAVQSFAGIFSDRNRSFEQPQNPSPKEHLDETYLLQ